MLTVSQLASLCGQNVKVINIAHKSKSLLTQLDALAKMVKHLKSTRMPFSLRPSPRMPIESQNTQNVIFG